MDVILIPLYNVFSVVLELFKYALIASVILSWLVAFGIINTHNRAVYTVMDVLYRVTEPALRPIRRIIPHTGGVDLSPLALILIILLIQGVLGQLVARLVY
jgi:YggT family protein